MIALALVAVGLAWAAPEIAVLAPEPLRPGVPGLIEVLAVDEGRAVSPVVRVGVPLVAQNLRLQPGISVWALPAQPPGEVSVEVEAGGARRVVRLPVAHAAEAELTLTRPEAVAGDAEVRVGIVGAGADAAAIAVASAEGTVVGVVPAGDHLEAVIRLSPTIQPRYVPVAVWDRRQDRRPVWTLVRVRARTATRYQTEAGASVSVSVGRRSYGPFVADASGVVKPSFDQYPGDAVAAITVTDTYGNENRTSAPLTPTPEASMLAVSAANVVWVRAWRGDGRDWDVSAGGRPVVPRCAAGESLAMNPVAPGLWSAPVASGARVVCTLAEGSVVLAETQLQTAASPPVPDRIELRIWPDRPNADFPVADVQAVVLDAAGGVVSPEGVVLSARHGAVRELARSERGVRAEYDGTGASVLGEDLVRAELIRPPTVDVPASIDVVVVSVDEQVARVAARVLSLDGRPIAGVPVTLSLGDLAVEVVSSARWTEAALSVPRVKGTLSLTASTRWRQVQHWVARGGGPIGARGPGQPDLRVEQQVRFNAARVAVLDVEVDPQVLYVGRGSFATVRVRARDRQGRPTQVTPAPLEVSVGTVGPWVAGPEGVWSAEYLPPPGAGRAQVQIVARAEGTSSRAELELEPAPVDRSLQVGVGVLSNLGRIVSPYVGVDVEARTGFFSRKLLFRFGVAAYQASADVDAGLGDPVSLRLGILPISGLLLTRGDYHGDAVWGGIGAVLAPYRSVVRFGLDAKQSFGLLPPGLCVVGGYGRRLGRGELLAELRATALSGVGGDVGFTGSVGGISLSVGYRFIP